MPQPRKTEEEKRESGRLRKARQRQRQKNTGAEAGPSTTNISQQFQQSGSSQQAYNSPYPPLAPQAPSNPRYQLRPRIMRPETASQTSRGQTPASSLLTPSPQPQAVTDDLTGRLNQLQVSERNYHSKFHPLASPFWLTR